jgi:hypothetical protein
VSDTCLKQKCSGWNPILSLVTLHVEFAVSDSRYKNYDKRQPFPLLNQAVISAVCIINSTSKLLPVVDITSHEQNSYEIQASVNMLIP